MTLVYVIFAIFSMFLILTYLDEGNADRVLLDLASERLTDAADKLVGEDEDEDVGPGRGLGHVSNGNLQNRGVIFKRADWGLLLGF